MKNREIILVFLLFFLITLFFFYKTIFQGLVPFPGDLLIAEYNPWKTYSYLGYNPGSFPNKAQYFDVLRQLYPWKTFSINLLKVGEIPLWNPYNFSGVPLLANFQSGVFYPFNLFYLIFSQIQVWSVLVILQPLLACFFTYLFARKIGISKIGSLFSAISYGFSSFMTVWLEYNTIGHVIMWLPFSLLAVEMILKKATALSMMFFITSVVAALLAGHPQVLTYLLVFIVLYLVYRTFTAKKSSKDKVKELLTFSLLIMLSIAMGAIQIIPGIELIKESARVPHDYNFLIHKILIQPWQFVMMVIPDFFGNPATRNYWPEDTYIGKVTYIGVIPLFFVLLSFNRIHNNLTMKQFNNFPRSTMIRFFAVASIIVLSLVSFNPITTFLYKFNLSFISSSAPTLSIFLFCFCVSILAGFGIDIYRREKWNITRVIKFVTPLIFIILFLWIIVLFAPSLISDKLLEHLTIAKRNLLYATFLAGVSTFLILVGTVKKRLVFLTLILLLLIQTGDLFRYFTKFNPFVPKELVFPKADVLDFLETKSGIDRFWGYGSANIEANFATQYSLFSTDGYDPLYPKRYGEFIQASEKGKIETRFTRSTRSDAVIASGGDLLENSYRLKILDLLGVKYILDRFENASREETFPKDRFKLIYEKGGWRIYQNLKVLPRAFLVSDYKVFRSNEEFEKIFFDKNFDPSKTILLEEELKNSPRRSPFGHLRGARPWHTSDGGEATTSTPPRRRVENYNPNKVIISTASNSDALLFLSDTYYPGWNAFIDNKETKIYRANYAFRAVAVPEGKHEVKFVYDPNSFRIGLGISAISLILTSILLTFLFIRPKSIAT